MAQTVPGFQNPAGYRADSLNLASSAFAVGPDGKLAVAQDNASGGATITIYDKIGAGRTALKTISAPAGTDFQFFGGIAWKDANTLSFSEDGKANTVFSASLNSSTVTPLAPLGTLPYVAQIAYKPGDATGTLYAGLAGGPNANAVYTISGGAATPFATGIGNGYLGGLAFRPSDGALFVGDTNDPSFTGNAGQALQLNANGTVGAAYALKGGGSGVSELTFDTASNLYATTGGTITELPNGSATAQNFGTFAGGGLFTPAGGIQFFGGDFTPYGGGIGTLLVNGGFTGVSGLFTLQPSSVPEPSGLAALFCGTGGLVVLRRRKIRKE